MTSNLKAMIYTNLSWGNPQSAWHGPSAAPASAAAGATSPYRPARSQAWHGQRLRKFIKKPRASWKALKFTSDDGNTAKLLYIVIMYILVDAHTHVGTFGVFTSHRFRKHPC